MVGATDARAEEGEEGQHDGEVLPLPPAPQSPTASVLPPPALPVLVVEPDSSLSFGIKQCGDGAHGGCGGGSLGCVGDGDGDRDSGRHGGGRGRGSGEDPDPGATPSDEGRAGGCSRPGSARPDV